jgi:dihydroorotate dehydrogenase electron transfer subunit
VKLVATKVVRKPIRLLRELERQPRPGARNVSGSWLIWLCCPDIAREARPGQFVMVRCTESSVLPRPFSIHRVGGDDIALFFAVWEHGEGTRWLSERQTGDAVEMFERPLGNCFTIKPGSKNLLLLAGGTGIAPLLFLAERARDQGYSVKLLRGASGELKPSGKSNAPQHYPEGLLPNGIDLETIITSRDGRRGMVLELITPEIVDWADQVFACGPSAMYRDMVALSRQFPALKSAQVSLETRMGCGRGICYGCTVRAKSGLKQVCRDGPVFELGEVVWDDPVFSI